MTTLRHPLHVAKSAASLDKISNQRFLLGVATGDRPIEFPAFKVDHNESAALFRESIAVMKKVWKRILPANSDRESRNASRRYCSQTGIF